MGGWGGGVYPFSKIFLGEKKCFFHKKCKDDQNGLIHPENWGFNLFIIGGVRSNFRGQQKIGHTPNLNFSIFFLVYIYQKIKKTTNALIYYEKSKWTQIKSIKYFLIKTKTNQIDLVFHDQAKTNQINLVFHDQN